MSSIRLHPEHGVNPTVSQCFFCGKTKNELALLGASYRGQAPRQMVLNYDPCEECQTNMARGITLIECEQSYTPLNRPAIKEGLYPTGSWCVLKEDAVKRIFKGAPMLDDVLRYRKTFVEVGVLKKLGVLDKQEGTKAEGQ